MTVILGLNTNHDGAACVVVDGKIKSALTQERLSRKKKQHGVSLDLIEQVLKQANCELADVNYVTLAGYVHGTSDFKLVQPWDKAVVDKHIEDLLLEEYHREYVCVINGRSIPAMLVHHHMSHCASAFYTSSYQKAACLSMDSSFNFPRRCSLYAVGDGLDLHPFYCPGLMIGNAYSRFTELLGIGDGTSKAGSTMGLAAYGRAIQHRSHERFVQNWSDRSFTSDTDFINWLWTQLSGQLPHSSMSGINQKTMDIAATLQMIFEEVTLQATRVLFEELQGNHDGHLCLSGGSFLNCNANSKILLESGFNDVHLFPACGDDGTAVGSALYLAHQLLRLPRASYRPSELSYLGLAHTFEGGQKLDLDLVVDALTSEKVVGWFSGRSEFGPRALGNRSILADPRSPKMRDHLNLNIKKREWYRPFGPVVLEEKASEWFDWKKPSPFMLHTMVVRDPEKIPAVTHVDGTARIQTVAQAENPRLHELISRFYQKTGVPMLLNTSLNTGGEPLVESPQDAIRTFERSNLDLLVVEDRMVLKPSAEQKF